MAHDFVAYVDEAGDEGFGKLAAGPTGGQSRWLIVGACLVTREVDLKLPLYRDKILARFPEKRSRDLHSRHLNHSQKTVVCQELRELPLGACLTLSHKVTIPGSKWENTFKQKGYLYNYLLRWLLERLTTECHNRFPTCSMKLIFSRRGGTNYQSMLDYLRLMKAEREKLPQVRRINWSVLDIEDIVVENHSKWAGLQLADCFCSAFFSGVEQNVYGNYETSYGHLLAGNLLTDRRKNPLGTGLCLVPSFDRAALDEAQMAFMMSFRK